MTRVEQFEELRPLLFSVSYPILSSVAEAEAEDAVQEAWLRYQTLVTPPDSPKAFLSTMVTRISIDVLRSARRQRERYVEPWFPEPLLDDPYDDPERSPELADSVSMAALLLLERLTPLERAVFVLRDVFGSKFGDVASTVGRSEPACRQLAVRARRHMAAGRPRFEADQTQRRELACRFFAALTRGEVDSMRELLAGDVAMVADAGGKGPLWCSGIYGAANVVRILAAMAPAFLAEGGTIGQHDLIGEPGAVLRDRDDSVANTLTLDIVDGQIQTIRAVINPDKLAHLGPVADAYAMVHKANQTLRDRRQHRPQQ